MPLVVVLFIAMIAFIVLMTDAERRIPVQYAKRVVGRKHVRRPEHLHAHQGKHERRSAHHLCLRLPGDPRYHHGLCRPNAEGGFWKFISNVFSTTTACWYAILYFMLIIAFNYFYVAIQYNPIEMANNLRKNNGAIPGIRPGKAYL